MRRMRRFVPDPEERRRWRRFIMKNKLLEVKNLKKIFHTEKDDVLALENVSFDVSNV